MRIELSEGMRSTANLAALFGAKMTVCGIPSPFVCGICTDTAEIRQGDLFLALQGSRADGSAYFSQALAAGAIALLGKKQAMPSSGDFTYMSVQDTAIALLRAASQHRSENGRCVVAITGSAGKTTTKEAIAAVLGDVPHNLGNFNSTVGMPLSVLGMPVANFWVCELGINHVGEMQQMVQALCPDIGVITNVGTAHIGQFGNFATLLREKMGLAAGIPPHGTLLVPHELKKSVFLVPLCHLLSFGTDVEADFCVENITVGQKGLVCDLRGRGRVITNLAWPVAGRIGVSVIACAGAAGILADRTEEQIRVGLAKAAKKSPRMGTKFVAGHLFLDDCYNASPEAMVAALEAFGYCAGDRARVAVLGDMLELGKYEAGLHAMVGAAAAKAKLSLLFTYGRAAAYIAKAAEEGGMPKTRIFHFDVGERDALCERIATLLPKDAAVLWKASHGIRLSEIVKRVEEML